MPALIQADDGTIWDAEKEPNPDVHGNESRNSFKWNCYHHWLGKLFQGPVKSAILRAIDTVHNKYEYSFEDDFLVLQNALYESIRARINEDPNRKQPFMLKVADFVVLAAQNESVIVRLKNNKLFCKSVDYAHKGIQKYDPEAYIYADARLQTICSVLVTQINKNWQDNSVLLECADIILFLMKEDIYYRPRWIQILQDVRSVVEDLTDKNNSVLLNGFSKLCEAVKDFELTPEELDNIERWH